MRHFIGDRRLWSCFVELAFVSVPVLAHAQSREPAPPASVCAPAPDGSLTQAFLRVAQPASDGSVVVTLCLRAVGGANGIGSYRGEIRFDSTRAELVGVEQGKGGMRTENPAHRGRLLFAGASPSGFKDPIVLRAKVRLLGGQRALPPLTLTMAEIWSVAGLDLSRQARVNGYSPGRTTSAAIPASSRSNPTRSTAAASSLLARDAFSVSSDLNAHRAS